VGIVGLAENMPDGRSYRPSDVLGSMSGKNIEIINTDAEGRLVLADCLTYVQRTWNPETLIDLATLTGSMISALGFDYCGTFVNDDDLWSNLEKAGSRTGEKLWRMPLDEQWRTEVVSTVADLRNIGTMGSYAGACTAAGFLENFIEGNARWAHLDLAGVAWTRSDRPTIPKGASGFGVRVLDSFIEGNYEEKP
jgi:leucyl aminopeptidase